MTTNDEEPSDILPDDKLRVDRSAVSFGRLTDGSNDVAYWQSRSMSERLAAIEFLRRLDYGDAACNGRVLRVLEFARRSDHE